MLCVHPIDLDEVSPNAAYAADSLRELAVRRTFAALQSALAPSILLPALVFAFGCYALFTLTGVGPDSWQMQVCARGYAQARSCQAPSVERGSQRGWQAVRQGAPS